MNIEIDSLSKLALENFEGQIVLARNRISDKRMNILKRRVLDGFTRMIGTMISSGWSVEALQHDFTLRFLRARTYSQVSPERSEFTRFFELLECVPQRDLKKAQILLGLEIEKDYPQVEQYKILDMLWKSYAYAYYKKFCPVV